MTALARPQNRRAILFGTIALLIFTAVAAAGGYWWNEHNRPSQASKADCTLAQHIIDEAQKLPGDKTAVDKWEQDTAKTRRAQMKDGYLGYNIAQYEGWAATKAMGETGELTDKDLRDIQDKANSHCTDADVKLTFPSSAS